MPQKMSIEVVKHSDDDIRIIVRDGSSTERLAYRSSEEALSFLSYAIDTSSIFLDTTMRNSVVSDLNFLFSSKDKFSEEDPY